MREAESSRAPQRKRDLTVVHVAGEDEVERSRRQEVEHVREVTEQDAEVRIVVLELPRPGAPLAIRARVDSDDLHAPITKLDGLALVDQEPCGAQLAQLPSVGERIAGVLDVVIPKHRERRTQATKQLAQINFAVGT